MSASRALVGFIHFDRAPLAPDLALTVLQRMQANPAHAAHWSETGIFLGYLRQTNLPEDRDDPQPCLDPVGRFALATTAVLTNRPELRSSIDELSQLADADYAQLPDSVIVRAAFRRWGVASFAKFDGAFSCAIWEPNTERLICACDSRAQAPLYYWREGPRFAFASTLRGLLAIPGVPRELHAPAIAEHAAGIIRPTDETLYRNIHRLRAGHVLIADRRGLRTEPYWQPDSARVLALPSEADYAAAFRAELRAAVERTLSRSPRHVALLLSGGLDSSAVAAVAAPLLAARGERLQAIHLRHTGPAATTPQRERDEFAAAAAVAAHVPTLDYLELESRSQPVPRPAWDEFFAHHCVPFRGLLMKDPALSEALDRLGIGTLWTGGAGNALVSLETLPSGYLTHLALTGRWLTWWQESRALAAQQGHAWRRLARATFLSPWKRRVTGAAPASYDPQYLFFLHPSWRENAAFLERVDTWHAEVGQPPRDFRAELARRYTAMLGQGLLVSSSTLLPGPTFRSGGAPLADRRLNEFCLSLPFDQHIRDGWDRRLIREGLSAELPASVRYRVTRGMPQPGFESTLALAAPWLDEEIQRLGQSDLVRQIFDYDRLREGWAARDREKGRPFMLVKTIVCAAFLQWHEAGNF